MRGFENYRAFLEQNVGHPIGRSAQIPANSGDAVGLLDLSGDDPTAELVTIGLIATASESTSEPFSGQGPRNLIIAQLDFGTGGANARAFVTINRGCLVTLPVTGLKVTVSRVLAPGGAAPNPPITVQAWAAYGSRPSNNSAAPLFEWPVINLDPSTSVSVAIPPFAWTVYVLPASVADFLLTPNFGTVDILDSAGSVLAQYSAAVQVPLANLPLPARAKDVRLNAPAGAARQNFTLQFGLSL